MKESFSFILTLQRLSVKTVNQIRRRDALVSPLSCFSFTVTVL